MVNEKNNPEKNDKIPETADELLKQSSSEADSSLESKSDLDKCREELAQYKDRYLRLYAEFDNARKRMERERIEFVKYANEGLIVDFLGILDDLERSVEAAMTKHEDYAAFLKGIELVMSQLHETLKKYGVRAINAKGTKFDPHCHEVLLQEETDAAEEGTVLEEFQKGYFLEEKVIRTSKVKLAKSKEIH
jgi:molecular chaperone GrpE